MYNIYLYVLLNKELTAKTKQRLVIENNISRFKNLFFIKNKKNEENSQTSKFRA